MKITLEGDLSDADPELNPGTPIDDLANMYMQGTLGDDVFFLNTTWEGEKYGWRLSDEYMQPTP